MKAEIIIPKERLVHIHELSQMTTKEILEKYGYRKEATLHDTVVFENGVEARIQLTIMPEDDWYPITDITLFKDGRELTHETSMDSQYEGVWEITFDGVEYIVSVHDDEMDLTR